MRNTEHSSREIRIPLVKGHFVFANNKGCQELYPMNKAFALKTVGSFDRLPIMKTPDGILPKPGIPRSL